MIRADVDVQDNSQAVVDSIRAALRNGLEDIGAAAEYYAKSIVPVDTGRLRDSIGYAVNDDTVTLYADTEYAIYVEYGTLTHRAQPYLYPSMAGHTQEYVSMLVNAVANK